MAKKKPQKGTLNWCIKQAAAYGVSYGRYMAEYYERDMQKGAGKCCMKNSKD